MAITEKELKKAQETLRKYKDGKKRLEARIKEEEKWYRLRHWDVIQDKADDKRPKPTSAWLFNVLMNKHADAMDNFPECSVLPREEGDRQDAETLSDIIPVILEQNRFHGGYSYNWWEKLKHGTGIYGVFWNPRLENGLGDIDVKRVDILNISWEPGKEDIQESRNLFVENLVDNDVLEEEYPETRGKLGSGTAELAQYDHDDTIDLTGKSVVVDWYYKVVKGGRTLLHYVKYVGDTILFASENEKDYAERGFYDHGKYPFVFDVLFPEKGSPCGFGYIALCKDPQLYIDKLSQILLENAVRAGKKRWFIGAHSGVNKEQFANWEGSEYVDVEGSANLDETHMREITTVPLPGSIQNILQMKINEMKETSSNRDVSNGGTASGVTAAAAIAALQEAGNKNSRDMIDASYRAYTELDYLVLELVRQFYDRERSFRITGNKGTDYSFIRYSNKSIRDQQTGVDSKGNPLMRRPVFDIKIKAQRKNPFSQLSQNELAKELYGLGVFNPERAEETSGMLEMMEFEGKDRVLERVRQGQTLLNQVQELSQRVQQMEALLSALGGGGMPDAAAGDQAPSGGGVTTAPKVSQVQGRNMEQALEGAVAAARTPYMERLAKRSQVDMDTGALTPEV